MHAKLRKVGGSTMIALPPHVLDGLGLRPGATLDVAEEDGRVVLRPVRGKPSLEDLLAACSPPDGVDLDPWTSDTAVGDEVI